MDRSQFITAVLYQDIEEIKRQVAAEKCSLGLACLGEDPTAPLDDDILSMTFGNGKTPLMIAATEAKANSIKYFIKEMQISPRILNLRNEDGDTALMMAASQKGKQSVLCVQYLAEAGTDLNLVNKKGCTPLILALRKRSTQAVSLLLDKGASVNTGAPEGFTPLSFAMGRDIPKLIRYGLDPTRSRRDQDCLHKSAKKDRNAVVRALVRGGFPPLDFLFVSPAVNRAGILAHRPKIENPISPLAVALYAKRPDVAKYLVLNRFFTRYDVLRLCQDGTVRENLEVSRRVQSAQTEQCLEVVDFLSSVLTRPLSLRDLCLVTVSSALSHDFATYPQGSLEDQDTWMCKPTFVERVESLTIPPAFKRELLHQTPSSAVCVRSWEDITLGEENNFPPCYCKFCDGEDNRY
ncbi:ankyrin repeat, SAM and basic leucine zipper domain-containing protein 1 [Elysia marginata]|uniref:Ankyrin repeat, SAM and basic leucine zipper domain-containing protein 1 n=1 Tax=Elysia marginata TaxID=1093978 RepID=A0AAV4HLV7_9GAST|nr:ankyrin repeat, SAM and basic leucine zipper domain-containing protein 1 [Elysia marginata]